MKIKRILEARKPKIKTFSLTIDDTRKPQGFDYSTREGRAAAYEEMMKRKQSGQSVVNLYIGATSYKHAMQMMEELGFGYQSPSWFRKHVGDRWGDSMKGIEPEIGVWQQFRFEEPERVL